MWAHLLTVGLEVSYCFGVTEGCLHCDILTILNKRYALGLEHDQGVTLTLELYLNCLRLNLSDVWMSPPGYTSMESATLRSSSGSEALAEADD